MATRYVGIKEAIADCSLTVGDIAKNLAIRKQKLYDFMEEDGKHENYHFRKLVTDRIKSIDMDCHIIPSDKEDGYSIWMYEPTIHAYYEFAYIPGELSFEKSLPILKEISDLGYRIIVDCEKPETLRIQKPISEAI